MTQPLIDPETTVLPPPTPENAPHRQFWLSYVIDAADGIGHGAGNAYVKGPVTAGVLEAWKQGLEALPANRARRARIVIQTWTELEA